MSFNDVVKTLSISVNIAENVTPNGMRATSAGGDYGRTTQKISARNAATPKHHTRYLAFICGANGAKFTREARSTAA